MFTCYDDEHYIFLRQVGHADILINNVNVLGFYSVLVTVTTNQTKKRQLFLTSQKSLTITLIFSHSPSHAFPNWISNAETLERKPTLSSAFPSVFRYRHKKSLGAVNHSVNLQVKPERQDMGSGEFSGMSVSCISPDRDCGWWIERNRESVASGVAVIFTT